MKLRKVIQKPILTEKAMEKQEDSCYLFWVDRRATKTQIKVAVEKIFGVKPEKIRTVRVLGGKKAFIQLTKGEEISLAKLNE
jgi:large subunit ribosomal protein L23